MSENLRQCSYCQAWNSRPCGEGCLWSPDDPAFDPAAAAADKARIERLEDGMKPVMASLVAAISILDRAEQSNIRPSLAVASYKMFRQMITDYENALKDARAALSALPSEEPAP